MAASKPQLMYWDIRGYAEPIRFLLNYLEVDFEDVKLPFGDLSSVSTFAEPWTKQKFSHGLDFPNLPYYLDDGLKITQTNAILQHIGRKYDLYGDTLEDKARIDMVAMTLVDLGWAAWYVFNHPTFHQIKDDWKKTFPVKLSPLNKFLDGKDFVIGSKISWVDFLLFENVEQYRQCAPEVFEEAPELENLKNFQKRIEALPQIKAYMSSDKFHDWPFFFPFTYWGHSKDTNFKPFTTSPRNMFSGYPLDP